MGLDSLIGRRKTRPHPKDLLKIRPVRCQHVKEIVSDDGAVVLEVPLTVASRGLVLWMAKRTGVERKRQFELEPVDALVWSMCDGAHGCEAISKALCAQYKMTPVEARAALGAFLQTLLDRGLIAIIDKEKR